jgi:hypothetical protein
MGNASSLAFGSSHLAYGFAHGHTICGEPVRGSVRIGGAALIIRRDLVSFQPDHF